MPVIIAFIVLALIASVSGVMEQKGVFPSLASLASISQIYPLGEEKEPEISSGAVVVPEGKYQPAKPVIPPEEEEPPLRETLINTYLISGPRTGEIIENTNKITFKFGGEILSEEVEGQIVFETKVEGLDDDWKTTSSQKRTITFPLGPKEYTFLVRAKVKNTDIVDPTPIKRTFEINVSPYFDKVRISKLENPPYPDPFLITLAINLGWGDKSEIDISGWEIEGKYGTFKINQGVEYLNPSVDDLVYENIIIKRGYSVYISSASNPLGAKDRNFRTNKCTGYLTSSHNFPIPISENCPRLEKEDLPWGLSYYCKEYILSLGKCERPDYQGMEEHNLFDESECMDYMNSNLNYGGCYRNYYRDNNFLENKWYIYIDRLEKDFFDRKIDTVYLKDKDGLLIDEYIYK